MPKSTSSNQKKTEIKGFFGIDRSHFSGERGCERLENFRIDSSGTLVKRPGRKKLFSFNTPICTAIDFAIESPDRPHGDCLVAAPPYLHALSLEHGDDMILSSNIGDPGSKVDLAILKQKPYLFDGRSVKTISDGLDSMVIVDGYVPLYGKSWDPQNRGPVNEPANILSGNLRINYKIENYTDKLYVGLSIFSVSRVEINGVSTSNYLCDGDSVVGDFPAGSSVDVWVSRLYFNTLIGSCRSAVTVGGGATERIVAFESDDSSSLLFFSSPVSDEDLEASRRGFPDSKPLYFPEDSELDLGFSISAVCPCGDSFLIFSERNATLAKPNGLSCELYPLSASVGCIAPHAAIAKNRSVFAVSKDGFYRFDVDLSEPDKTVVKKISVGLEGDDFIWSQGTKVFDNPAFGELWFGMSGRIFIYNIELDTFYVYTDLYSRAMLSQNDFVYLFDEYSVWRFADIYLTDEDDGAFTDIEAVAVTRWLDFGDITEAKKVLTVHPIYDVDPGGSVKISVLTDGGLEYEQKISGDDSPAPSQRKLRISRCRFRCAQLKISSTDGSRPKIYGAVLSAQS